MKIYVEREIKNEHGLKEESTKHIKIMWGQRTKSSAVLKGSMGARDNIFKPISQMVRN